MDFNLNEEQTMLKQVAREWLSKHCPKTLVREMEADERGYTAELWKGMADNGWLGLVVPEEYGGSGMSFVDLAVLLEEMGRALLPGPYISTAVLAAQAILEGGHEKQKNEYLPALCSGRLIATLALTEQNGGWDLEDVQLKATRDGGDFILDGLKLFVPDANVADLLITAARTENGVSLFLVDRNTPGVEVTLLKTIANDKQCEVVYDRVRVASTRLLSEVDKGWKIIASVLEKAAAAKCAESLGGAQQVLEMTVQYAKDRVQFGRPIGSFQVIQHYCANMATDVDCIRFVTYQAAWKIAQGGPASEEVAVAKAFTGDAYRRTTATAQQVHGAIGFTMEHDAQLYFRRAKTAELIFGDPAHHRQTVAQALGI